MKPGIAATLIFLDRDYAKELSASLGKRGCRSWIVDPARSSPWGDDRFVDVVVIQIPPRCERGLGANAPAAQRNSIGDDTEYETPQNRPALGSLAFITESAARFPRARIIALAPPHDTATTRDAFRTGAWDCCDWGISVTELSTLILHAATSARGSSAQNGREKAMPNCFNVADAVEATASPSMGLGSLGKQHRPLERIARWARKIRSELRLRSVQSIWSLVAAVEARDPFTQSHSLSVALMTEAIGKRMGLMQRRLESLRAAALLHDIGKIGIPDSILHKPGPLTKEEFEIIKIHPQLGAKIIAPTRFLGEARELLLHHHERFDGKGYPTGIHGCDIPQGARILSVMDAVDAMMSPRAYKPAYNVDRVRSELRLGMQKQFDPDAAQCALNWLDERPQSHVG